MSADAPIYELLLRDLPRELVLSIDEAAQVAAGRAFKKAQGVHRGHFNSYLGQVRHFEANEAFHAALAAAGADPTPIRGNSVITGKSGMFVLARFAARGEVWINARRSVTRRQLSLMNKALEYKIQASLFGTAEERKKGLVFFFATFSTDPNQQADAPASVSIAVPDSSLKKWLFVESISDFIARYNSPTVSTTTIPKQPDVAFPTRKRHQKDGTKQ